MTRRIAVRIQDQVFPADLADTVAADQLYARLEKEPLTITAHDYGGFEKVGDLGQTLSASDHQMTTESGDLVLYQSDQIVLFYGSNRWFYTKLASLKDTTGLEDALGSGEISYTLFIPES
ncbi:cyclophilin-like fold protein [Erysipelotrichaceae bacterium 51-3]